MSQLNFTFWRDFVALGEEAKILSDNFDISEFKNISNGFNFFHYYSGRYDIMKVFHDKFQQMENEGTMTQAIRRCPMMILGKDKNGHTALHHCVTDQQWKNFNIMLKMVMWQSGEYMISKLIIEEIPAMLSNPTPEDIDFFEKSIYKPKTMQKTIEMPWFGEEDEYFFASNTSLIDAAILKREFPYETSI